MIQLEIILKTVLAIVLGGAVGMERQNKHRPAGFKTHILVCMGAMTIMTLSQLIFERYYNEYGYMGDPSRLSAQVVSGIGFLGAGTIIHHGINVRGLTTAATLWVVAAIGLTIGAGFYYLAITVTFALFATLSVFNFITEKMQNTQNMVELKIEMINKPKTLGVINMIFANNSLKVVDMEMINLGSKTINDREVELILLRVLVSLAPESEIHTIVESIEASNGVFSVERI